MKPSDNTFFLNSIAVKEFSKDILDFISWQSTVTFFNLQLAYFLGFDEVYLIGVDNSYKQPDKGNEGALIKEDKDDVNHFSKDYFKGLTWQKADTDAMEYVYVLAGKAFQEDGREIINAGAGGNLEVFRRTPYEGLFQDEVKPDSSNAQFIKGKGRENGNDVVISINPSLKNSYGHWLHYDLKIKDFLNKRQVDFYSFANLLLSKDISTKYNRNFLPIFTSESFYSKNCKIKLFKKKIFEDELTASIRIARKAHPEKKIKAIFYMGSFSVLPALQKVLDKLENVEFYVNLFWEHFNLDELEHNKDATIKIMKNIDQAKMKVFVDTEELKELFKQKLDIEYPVWPMFSISNFTLSSEDEQDLAGDVLDENNIRITFPGNSRVDKGFGLTLNYLESLSESDQKRFQVTIRDAGREDDLYDKRLDALKNNKSWLRILEGTIDEDDYQDLFYYSDIIVIPYTLKSFRTRTSAVLCDSIIMQKPVIAVKGTWMGNQIEKYNIGRTIEDDNAEELKAAIADIIKDYKFYKNNIINMKNDWLKEHNIDSFVNSVLKIC
jgi:glycosyltransferase involved in cell wall biosynthesis